MVVNFNFRVGKLKNQCIDFFISKNYTLDQSNDYMYVVTKKNPLGFEALILFTTNPNQLRSTTNQHRIPDSDVVNCI